MDAHKFNNTGKSHRTVLLCLEQIKLLQKAAIFISKSSPVCYVSCYPNEPLHLSLSESLWTLL